MQTKLLQFYSLTNPDTIPYKFPTVGAGDGAMERGMPYQGHRTMVRPYNSATVQRYDVQCMTSTTHDVQRTTSITYDIQQYNIVTYAV